MLPECEVIAIPVNLPELLPGGLLADNRLKSYIHASFELEFFVMR